MKRDLQLTGPLLTLATEGQAELPTRVKFLNWGDNATVKGIVRVGEKTVAALREWQAKLGFDKICLDYNHNTVPGTAAYKETTEPRKVAAYGLPEVVPGEGLFLNAIEYTPDGLVNARNFKDLSATVMQDKDDEVVFVHSVALCRQGCAPGMEFVTLSVELPEVGSGKAEVGSTAADPLLALGVNEEVIKVLTEKLAQSDWARKALDDAERRAGDMATENKALRETVTSLVARLETLEAQQKQRSADAGAGVLQALSADFAGKLTALSVDFDGRLAALAKRGILRDAAREGKVVALSAEAQAKLSPEELADHVARLTPTMPLGRLTTLSVQDPGDTSAGAPRIQPEIARLCGVDPAEAAKQPLPWAPR